MTTTDTTAHTTFSTWEDGTTVLVQCDTCNERRYVVDQSAASTWADSHLTSTLVTH